MSTDVVTIAFYNLFSISKFSTTDIPLSDYINVKQYSRLKIRYELISYYYFVYIEVAMRIIVYSGTGNPIQACFIKSEDVKINEVS